MPFVNITVNSELSSDQKSKLLEAAHDVIKTVLGKPDAYIAVSLNVNPFFIFAKTNDPCAMVQVQAIGGGGQAAASAGFTKALGEFGIKADRVFCNFQSFSGKDWAMAGSTFG